MACSVDWLLENTATVALAGICPIMCIAMRIPTSSALYIVWSVSDPRWCLRVDHCCLTVSSITDDAPIPPSILDPSV